MTGGENKILNASYDGKTVSSTVNSQYLHISIALTIFATTMLLLAFLIHFRAKKKYQL